MTSEAMKMIKAKSSTWLAAMFLSIASFAAAPTSDAEELQRTYTAFSKDRIPKESDGKYRRPNDSILQLPSAPPNWTLAPELIGVPLYIDIARWNGKGVACGTVRKLHDAKDQALNVDTTTGVWQFTKPKLQVAYENCRQYSDLQFPIYFDFDEALLGKNQRSKIQVHIGTFGRSAWNVNEAVQDLPMEFYVTVSKKNRLGMGCFWPRYESTTGTRWVKLVDEKNPQNNHYGLVVKIHPGEEKGKCFPAEPDPRAVKAPKPASTKPEQGVSATASIVMDIQQKLQEVGLYGGEIDGNPGPRSQLALEQLMSPVVPHLLQDVLDLGDTNTATLEDYKGYVKVWAELYLQKQSKLYREATDAEGESTEKALTLNRKLLAEFKGGPYVSFAEENVQRLQREWNSQRGSRYSAEDPMLTTEELNVLQVSSVAKPLKSGAKPTTLRVNVTPMLTQVMYSFEGYGTKELAAGSAMLTLPESGVFITVPEGTAGSPVSVRKAEIRNLDTGEVRDVTFRFGDLREKFRVNGGRELFVGANNAINFDLAYNTRIETVDARFTINPISAEGIPPAIRVMITGGRTVGLNELINLRSGDQFTLESDEFVIRDAATNKGKLKPGPEGWFEVGPGQGSEAEIRLVMARRASAPPSQLSLPVQVRFGSSPNAVTKPLTSCEGQLSSQNGVFKGAPLQRGFGMFTGGPDAWPAGIPPTERVVLNLSGPSCPKSVASKAYGLGTASEASSRFHSGAVPTLTVEAPLPIFVAVVTLHSMDTATQIARWDETLELVQRVYEDGYGTKWIDGVILTDSEGSLHDLYAADSSFPEQLGVTSERAEMARTGASSTKQYRDFKIVYDELLERYGASNWSLFYFEDLTENQECNRLAERLRSGKEKAPKDSTIVSAQLEYLGETAGGRALSGLRGAFECNASLPGARIFAFDLDERVRSQDWGDTVGDIARELTGVR